MRENFHNEGQAFSRMLARLEREPMLEANRRHVQGFLTQLQAEGIGRLRLVKYAYHLIKIAKLMDADFARAGRPDVMKVFATLEGRPYSALTKRDFRIAAKRFYKWLRGTDSLPDEVRWLKHSMRGTRKLPEEMLTAAEIDQMVAVSHSARDRALVMLLYESGCRVGEIGNLRIRHIEFDDRGARVMVDGKTGMRRVRVVRAAPLIETWLSLHPSRQDRSAAVWIGLGQVGHGEPLNYPAIARVITRLAAKAGIRKRVYPHLFRHSRATELASRLMEAQLKEYLGWTQSSKQAATYVHLSGRNVDEAILRMHGLQAPDHNQDPVPVRCVRCDTVNGCDALFCQRCGLPTSQAVAMNADQARNEWDDKLTTLLQDPETLKFLAAKMLERLGSGCQPPRE